MYWFGEDLKNTDDWKHKDRWSKVNFHKKEFAFIPSDRILNLLDAFSKRWAEGSDYFNGAIPNLIKESGFSEDEVIKTLKILPQLLSRESLENRIRSEFTNIHVQDRFAKIPSFPGMVKAVPKGIILHVTAGNVFLSSIDSLLMGFITKNLSILKVSSSNQFFPLYFAKCLREFDQDSVLSDKFAILHWKGGEKVTEEFIKSKVNLILAWGGEEMIQNYRNDLPPQVKLVDFGPKISLQVITKDSLINKEIRNVAQAVVRDISPWNQAACASPQNLYLQEGIDVQEMLRELEEAFKTEPPRGPVSEDEAVEILKEVYRGYYSELMEGGKICRGADYLLHMEENKFLKPSPLGRSLIVKQFKDIDDLFNHLEPFSYYLQSCSYLFSEKEKDEYLNHLALTGIKRFAPLGTVTMGMDGAPHDGKFVLRELVDFIGDELRMVDYGESHNVLQTSHKLKQQFDTSKHPRGYIFSSGGTTGEPKYVHYSYEEFDRMTDMLAFNYKIQGILPGTTVANLFVAGNLWSSFLAVEKALEKIGAIQLPIGGLCPTENIITYLNKFKPQAVLGIPSLLVMYAEQALNQNLELNVPLVFYAGESMSESRREFLKKVWGTKYFGSGGYASVDAGVIGYQCTDSLAGEHHLFSDSIHMDIREGEAIVSSHSRFSLPIKNYATGDRVEWVQDLCPCGREDKKFKLLGRIDSTIQIWSCRLLLADIEKSLKKLDPSILSYQVILNEVKEVDRISEILKLNYETKENAALDPKLVIHEIYNNSRDLKDTISVEEFSRRLEINVRAPGEIKRNSRTGKISVIVDQRN